MYNAINHSLRVLMLFGSLCFVLSACFITTSITAPHMCLSINLWMCGQVKGHFSKRVHTPRYMNYEFCPSRTKEGWSCMCHSSHCVYVSLTSWPKKKTKAGQELSDLSLTCLMSAHNAAGPFNPKPKSYEHALSL